MVVNQVGFGNHRGGSPRGTSIEPKVFDYEYLAGLLYFTAFMICEGFCWLLRSRFDRELLLVQVE